MNVNQMRLPKISFCFWVPFFALASFTGCDDEPLKERGKVQKEVGHNDIQSKDSPNGTKSQQPPSNTKTDHLKENTKSEETKVIVVGKWKDNNKLSFEEDDISGTAVTSGTITFQKNGKWDSKGTVTLDGTLFKHKVGQMKFKQVSRGTWVKTDKEIRRTWTALTLTPQRLSPTAYIIKPILQREVKGEKEKFKILLLTHKRMELIKTETKDKVVLIRMD